MDEALATTLEIVGHGGAGSYAPSNSPEGFAAAVELGADRIEFDVLSLRDKLVLAHDKKHARDRVPLSLDAGLDLLEHTELPLSCDMKSWNVEEDVVRALRDRGLIDRTIACGHNLKSLQRMRALGPGLRIGWSVPEARGTPDRRVKGPAERALRNGWRERLPALVAGLLNDAALDGIMCDHRLLSRELVRVVHSTRGFVYAWTVDSAPVAKMVATLGVDGITTNDPWLVRQALADHGRA